jgi:hypothetical protein
LSVSGFGYTGRYWLAEKIRNSEYYELTNIEKKYGINRYNKGRAEKFYRFLFNWFTHYNKYHNHAWWPAWIKPPFHLNNNPAGKRGVNTGVSIKRIEVYFNQTWCTPNGVKILKCERIRQIDIY